MMFDIKVAFEKIKNFLSEEGYKLEPEGFNIINRTIIISRKSLTEMFCETFHEITFGEDGEIVKMEPYTA